MKNARVSGAETLTRAHIINILFTIIWRKVYPIMCSVHCSVMNVILMTRKVNGRNIKETKQNHIVARTGTITCVVVCKKERITDFPVKIVEPERLKLVSALFALHQYPILIKESNRVYYTCKIYKNQSTD